MAQEARSALITAVDVARGRLVATRLPLEGDGVAAARTLRQELVDQIDDYLLPRLRSDGAPLLVVVGGSTGAGKSTLVNSVLREPLTTPGVLRPTTRSPVLVHHPSDAPWFDADRVLPTLTRVGASSGHVDDAGRALRLAPFPGMPSGIALLDAPDVDSIETANRDLAAQLLAAADLWLFVTTAARYADAVPWEVLRGAVGRQAQVALVLDRLDPGSEEVVADFRRLVRENGLEQAPLFLVPEAELDEQGLLPAQAVAELSAWLTELGSDGESRAAIARATRDGVVGDLVASIRTLAAAADAQAESQNRLRTIVTSAYDDAAERLRAATSDGAMLRGEVLGRWQDFVGASDVMRALERGVSKVRDSVGSFFRGGRASAEPVEVAIAHGLEAVTQDAIETARERVRSAWRSDPAGRALVPDAQPEQSPDRIAREIRLWQDDVLGLVREQGEDRRGLARALSFGVNGLGVSVMLVVFAGTGGLTGAEVGIAGGTAVLAQRVLEAAFGDDAVRRLTKQAASGLQDRLEALLRADAATALTALEAKEISGEDGQALRQAAADIDAAAAQERAGRTLPQGPMNPTPAPTPSSDVEPPAPDPQRRGFWRRLFGRGR